MNITIKTLTTYFNFSLSILELKNNILYFVSLHFKQLILKQNTFKKKLKVKIKNNGKSFSGIINKLLKSILSFPIKLEY